MIPHNLSSSTEAEASRNHVLRGQCDNVKVRWHHRLYLEIPEKVWTRLASHTNKTPTANIIIKESDGPGRSVFQGSKPSSFDDETAYRVCNLILHF